MTKTGLIAIVGGLLIAGCARAPAGTADANDVAPSPTAAAPDLKGLWVGTSESIVTGTAKHHPSATPQQPQLSNVEFRYTVEGQDGRRFWGTLKSPAYTEMMTGVIARDGVNIVARTSSGEVRGVIVDPDTIDITYSQGGDATVVAVNTWKRQK